VLLASKLGEIHLRPPHPKKDRRKSVRAAIGRLDEISAGEVSEDDPLHRASNLTPINMRRLRASVAGGTWRDWDPRLVAACHRSKSGGSFPSVYGRMSWDLPAPTITTQFYGFGNGRFGHPEQDRALSLREGALLQTFPAKYRFTDPQKPIQFTSIGLMVGNAVPVRLGQVIGESLVSHARASSR
jgi:DNA (cytosine-5)-methyltransferase 1